MSIFEFGNGARQVSDVTALVRRMQDEHAAGAIDYKMPVTGLAEEQRVLVSAINDLVQAHIDVKMQVVNLIKDYG